MRQKNLSLRRFSFLELIGVILLAGCAPQPVPTPATPTPVTITYVCNDGFILETGDSKILVDALFQREDICDPQLTPLMRAALPPFDDADLVLVSHNHSDHFDPQIVGEYLSLTPGAVLVAEGDAIDALAQAYPGYAGIRERVTAIRLENGEWTSLSLNGIELKTVNAPADTPNLAFLASAGGRVFFHTGDMFISEVVTAAFQAGGLAEAGIDFAFIPFTWFIDPGGPEFMAGAIGAQEFIPMHIIDSNPEEVATFFRSAFPEVILLTVPLESVIR
jgi:L-ascorbate metabolism protein UlaG (beta-lactamase superfamily)